MRVSRRILLVAVVLTAGCAYYNGLYNANHLAKEARKAEREGRSGEARSLWAQAAVKAESVSSRYPKSRHRDDALLLQGTALRRVDACVRAIPPLTLASDSSPDSRIRHEASLARGQCYLELRQPDSAFAALRAIDDNADSATLSAARWWRGRAALALKRYPEALADLSLARERPAAFDRTLVLIALGRAPDAVLELEALVLGQYDEAPWLAVLDSLSVADPSAARSFVDRLAAREDLTRGQRARLLLGDGRRVRTIDPSVAEARWNAVVQVAGDSVEGRVARAHLGMTELRKMDNLAGIPAMLSTLREVTRDGGPPLTVTGSAVSTLDWLPELIGPEGDPLLLFIIAERMRDTVLAVPLAARLFRRVQEKAPESAIAPKALLAAAAIDTLRADSLVALVRSMYPDSPYTLMFFGTGAEARYLALEDSLRRAILMLPTLRPMRRSQNPVPEGIHAVARLPRP